MTTTPITPMLTKNTTELRILVQKHVAADQVAQGTYWDSVNQRGCFIGCLNHSSDPLGAENKFGLPIMVQRIAESIFEALPAAEAKAFFAALPDAVGCDGKDLSRVGWQFLAAELRALPATSAEIQAVIDPVIVGMELLATGQDWPAARAADWAARTAEAATWAATWAADWAADWAAEAAASAAEAAAWAADWAAEAAASAAEAATWAAAKTAEAATWAAEWAAKAAARATTRDAVRDADKGVRRRQRDLLLRLIAEAPVREEARSRSGKD